METQYLVQKVEIRSQHLMGETNSQTPNTWKDTKFSWEKLNEIAHSALDMIVNGYGKEFFKKLVVTVTYTIADGDDVQYAIDCGFDEEGEIYCS
jgi:hypothetical protein